MESLPVVLGLMSGSSRDGLDMALVRFSRDEGRWHYQFLASETIAYPVSLRDELLAAYTYRADQLAALDARLGRYFGEKCREFIDGQSSKPQLIASHGHTLYHQPALGFSQQIGHPAHIAAQTGINVAADFRSMDIALGGQGAPLVPLGDALLFPDYELCINLGGIANISFAQAGKRLAWDLACCNMVFDYLSEKNGQAYDAGGALAASGHCDAALLATLNALPYYQQKPPKSLGREFFEEQLQPIFDNCSASLADQMATYAEHLASLFAQLAKQYLWQGPWLVTGGGAYNSHLIKCIEKRCGISIQLPEKQLIDQKEALIFAFLGLLRWLGETNVYEDVTGSRSNHCGGNLYLAPTCVYS